jgi:hypothetical protein
VWGATKTSVAHETYVRHRNVYFLWRTIPRAPPKAYFCAHPGWCATECINFVAHVVLCATKIVKPMVGCEAHLIFVAHMSEVCQKNTLFLWRTLVRDINKFFGTQNQCATE